MLTGSFSIGQRSKNKSLGMFAPVVRGERQWALSSAVARVKRWPVTSCNLSTSVSPEEAGVKNIVVPRGSVPALSCTKVVHVAPRRGTVLTISRRGLCFLLCHPLTNRFFHSGSAQNGSTDLQVPGAGLG